MIEIINFLKEFDLHQILGTVVVVWVMTNYRFKKIDKSFEKIDKYFEKIENELKEIKESVNRIDNRLTRQEGRFEGIGYRESIDKKIGE